MGFGCHIGLAKNQYLPIGHISNMHKKNGNACIDMVVIEWKIWTMSAKEKEKNSMISEFMSFRDY